MTLEEEQKIYQWAANELMHKASPVSYLDNTIDPEYLKKTVLEGNTKAEAVTETVEALLRKLDLVDDTYRSDRPEFLMANIIERLARPSRRKRPSEGRKR